MKAHRPIVILSLDRIRQRLALGVTLNAGIIGVDVIHSPWIEDVVSRRVRDVV